MLQNLIRPPSEDSEDSSVCITSQQKWHGDSKENKINAALLFCLCQVENLSKACFCAEFYSLYTPGK